MSYEAITSVTQAETEAKITVQNAEAKAKQMLADAENAGKAAVEAACVKAESELQQLRTMAGEKAVNEAGDLSKDLENRKAELRAKAESRLEQAATLIVERIVNS